MVIAPDCGAIETDEQIGESRLARAGRTRHAEDLARRDGERQPLDAARRGVLALA